VSVELCARGILTAANMLALLVGEKDGKAAVEYETQAIF
jgi:hypothetical protein